MNNRLRELRKALHLKQDEMARILNKSTRMIQYYEQGKFDIETDLLFKIQELFNINLNWLITGTGSMFLSDRKEEGNVKYIDMSSLGSKFVEIREFPTVKASAGYGCIIHEEESVPYIINARFIENAEKEVIISVIGNSMQPELYENDKLLITTDFKYTSNPKKNLMYVIRADDGVYVKRYKQKKDNELIFISDNKRYGDIRLNINDCSERIIGKVKMHIREYN